MVSSEGMGWDGMVEGERLKSVGVIDKMKGKRPSFAATALTPNPATFPIHWLGYIQQLPQTSSLPVINYSAEIGKVGLVSVEGSVQPDIN